MKEWGVSIDKISRFAPRIVFTLIVIATIASACNAPSGLPPALTSAPVQPPGLAETAIALAFQMSPPEGTLTGTPFATGTPLLIPVIGSPQTLPAAATPSPVPATGQAGPYAYGLEETAVQILPKASYEYIVPLTLKLNETFLVELHTSRSLAESALLTQIVAAADLATSTSGPGTLVAPGGPPVTLGGGLVEVTPFMQATLFAEDREAFEITPLHADPVQVVELSSTVRWQWVIKAGKEGKQNLIFVIYRQANTANQAHWHTLQAERRVVEVNVTFDQRLAGLDWGWIARVFITLAAIAALWRWADSRKGTASPGLRSRQKRGEASRAPVREGPLSRLAGIRGMGVQAGQGLGNVFICYRRSDSADIAGHIYDRLVEEFGPAPIFKDVDSIPLGADFKTYLDRKVSECQVLLVIIGDRWLDASDSIGRKRMEDHADFVRVELESALKKEIPIIPLLVRGAQMPLEENLPYSLRRLVYKNGIQIRPDPDFHRDMDRLIEALEEYIGAAHGRD